MKILHLATHDNFGGAARAAYRQHLALLQQGVDSRMLVRHKHSGDEAVTVFPGERSLPDRIGRTVRRKWIAHLEKKSRNHRGKMICGLTDPRADLLRDSTAEMAEADVINFHKTEHFADLPALFQKIPASKPVVITLHDVSPVTGGCDYPGECRNFEKQCGACPMLDSNSTGDYSRQIFNLRQTAYAARPSGRLVFVGNSHWTGKMASQSGLTRGHRVEVIHYGLDQNIYSPKLRHGARQALGIGLDEPVIAFAAHDLSLKHKGGHLLHEALSALPGAGPIRLLTMGAGLFKAGPQYRHTHFGRVESDALQTLLYRAADVFIIPSLEEAFGQTALEAVACGTVVAGFSAGGIGDIVENGLNGGLVERGNTGALAQAIAELLKDGALRNHWANAAEAWVRDRFSYARNASNYVALYESLLTGKNAK
ncbi:MAG TPA: glycosyltransferase [Verrucomicrobiae bacterium]|jgi:glycosyltransferase involved in cell wall biosynthesis